MKYTKYTPAPWHCSNDPHDDGKPYHRIWAGTACFLDAHNSEDGSIMQLTGNISEANAKLIASAPTLLEKNEALEYRCEALQSQNLKMIKALEYCRNLEHLHPATKDVIAAALAEKACEKCGQVNEFKGGEYPCSWCGLPTLHDDIEPQFHEGGQFGMGA